MAEVQSKVRICTVKNCWCSADWQLIGWVFYFLLVLQ